MPIFPKLCISRMLLSSPELICCTYTHLQFFYYNLFPDLCCPCPYYFDILPFFTECHFQLLMFLCSTVNKIKFMKCTKQYTVFLHFTQHPNCFGTGIINSDVVLFFNHDDIHLTERYPFFPGFCLLPDILFTFALAASLSKWILLTGSLTSFFLHYATRFPDLN